MKYNLCFIGFGVVGQGLAKILLDKKEELKKKYGFEYEVVGICDILKGSVVSDKGLDLSKILTSMKKTGRISDDKSSAVDIIKNTNADIIIEVTYTNFQTGEPGMTHIKTALDCKKHVVTTNKGPIALAYKELKETADKNKVKLRFEGTVLGGTPAVNVGIESLAGAEIKSVRGILNGTTNFILTEMEKGMKYESALRKAQQLGYAEADPSGDVEGFDAAGKAVILANTLMGGELKLKDVERKGIAGITLKKIEDARDRGKKIKLVARVWREKASVRASVMPEELPVKDLLATVNGVLNAITFETDIAGNITIIGPGAGGIESGEALLSDMLAIHRMSGG